MNVVEQIHVCMPLVRPEDNVNHELRVLLFLNYKSRALTFPSYLGTSIQSDRKQTVDVAARS